MLLNKKLPIKYMLSGVVDEALFVLVLDVTCYYAITYFANDFEIDVPLSIPAFLGTAISVLLSFKMSQSYDRWWEARKIWGAIVNDSRSLIVQLQSFLLKGDHAQVIQRIAYRQIAWCYALGESLRGMSTSESLSKYLTPDDLQDISRQSNQPLAISRLIALEVKSLRESEALDSMTHVQVDNTLTRLVASMGKAERIKNTVFPPKYRLVLRSTIILFCVLLSISLKDHGLAFGLTVLILLSSIFFLLEHIASVLQDPFENVESDTPMTAIARTIEINIKQMIDDKEVPGPGVPEKYYVM